MANEIVTEEFVQYVMKSQPSNETQKFTGDLIKAIVCKEDYTIKLESIALWLDTKEGSLKGILTKFYAEDQDYKIRRKPSTGGRPKDDIFVTCDTFKRISMSSKAAGANRVRTYFAMVEETYHKFMTRTVNKRICKEKGPSIYAIKITHDGVVRYKIGRTFDLNKRFFEVQKMFPGETEIMYHKLFKGGNYLEPCSLIPPEERSFEVEREIVNADFQQVVDVIEMYRSSFKDCGPPTSPRKKIIVSPPRPVSPRRNGTYDASLVQSMWWIRRRVTIILLLFISSMKIREILRPFAWVIRINKGVLKLFTFFEKMVKGT